MHVKGHLVIAASGRMETSTSITDAFRKGRFHIHVDIFQFGLEFERSLFNIVKDARKPLHDLFGITFRNDARFGQHMRVGNAAADIFMIEALIILNGCVESVYQGICILTESSTP